MLNRIAGVIVPLPDTQLREIQIADLLGDHREVGEARPRWGGYSRDGNTIVL
jgi:hypothetical protein